MDDDRLLTTRQVARLLNLHPNTVKRWASLGEFPFFRVGRRGDRRYRQADIDQYLTAPRRWA